MPIEPTEIRFNPMDKLQLLKEKVDTIYNRLPKLQDAFYQKFGNENPNEILVKVELTLKDLKDNVLGDATRMVNSNELNDEEKNKRLETFEIQLNGIEEELNNLEEIIK